MSDMLAVRQLHAGYGEGDILKGVDVTLPAGQVVTIIGPNGSGKSTLLKTLAGLLPVRQGDIVLKGQSLKDLSAPRRVRAGLSYVPQEYNVFRNLTVLENLKIAREFMADAKTRGAAVISDELLELFPDLRGKFKARAGNLSGGQRQMLALACALAVRPEVLMLDEPSTGLSPKYMADIFETVRTVNARGVSVLMVEQNAIEALRISNTCVVMANGRVRMTAPADEVLGMKDLHSLYLGDARENAVAI
ncbi:MAG TPA: ABC transporter ATP-binding protein [Burkholderiales bacterium]|jgi:branched-chain amino acid transport system ATP-binding protein|nr:ABC transporter ATP-binding protein [Burkholderiales bacterium]